MGYAYCVNLSYKTYGFIVYIRNTLIKTNHCDFGFGLILIGLQECLMYDKPPSVLTSEHQEGKFSKDY